MNRSSLTIRLKSLWVLAILVGSFGIASKSLAVDHPVTWMFGTPQAPIAATVGDTITFTYAVGHTVEQFADQPTFSACDFSSATFLQGTGPAVVALSSAGTFYYGCSVGFHCANGAMSLEVSVAPAPAVPGANPIFVILALGCAGLLAVRAGRRTATAHSA
jgi:plastocyanin